MSEPVCEHGQLRRQCPICERDDAILAQSAELKAKDELIARLNDAGEGFSTLIASLDERIAALEIQCERLIHDKEALKVQRLTITAQRDAALLRLNDCELSLRVWDEGGSSEYWLRHPDRDVEERGPAGVLRCSDCGTPYRDFPLDVVLPDAQWLAVAGQENGVLCAACIVRRGSKLPGVTVAKLHFPDMGSAVENQLL